MDVKRALFGNSRQRSRSSSASGRRLAGRRRENTRRNNAKGGPKASALVQHVKDSHTVEEAASSSQSTVRPDDDPVLGNHQPRAYGPDTGPRDIYTQSETSNIALLDGVPANPYSTEDTSLSDEGPVELDYTAPPTGYSHQGIETWRHAAQVPDGPDWARLTIDRLRLPSQISSIDMITETAVAIHSARDALALASKSPTTSSTIHTTSTHLIRTLALSLGIASGAVAMRNLPDLAQRVMDPAGEVNAVWVQLSPDLAELGLANLEEELQEAVEREVERLEAESFEMRRDSEWGHFPGMGGVAKELGVDEFREPRWDDDVSHIPERDLAMEADIWFEIWGERRERGEALCMWEMGEEQEWPTSREV